MKHNGLGEKIQFLICCPIMNRKDLSDCLWLVCSLSPQVKTKPENLRCAPTLRSLHQDFIFLSQTWEHVFISSTALQLHIHLCVSFYYLNFKLPWCRRILLQNSDFHLDVYLWFWALWVWLKISLVQLSLLRIMFDSKPLEWSRCTSKCDVFFGIYAHEISHELH